MSHASREGKPSTLTARFLASAALAEPAGVFTELESRLLRIMADFYGPSLSHARMPGRDADLLPLSEQVVTSAARAAFSAAVEAEGLLRSMTDGIIRQSAPREDPGS